MATVVGTEVATEVAVAMEVETVVAVAMEVETVVAVAMETGRSSVFFLVANWKDRHDSKSTIFMETFASNNLSTTI